MRAGWHCKPEWPYDADAVLIPEIPYDLRKVAAKLREKAKAGQTFGLVVVAEGAKPMAGVDAPSQDFGPKNEGRTLSRGHGRRRFPCHRTIRSGCRRGRPSIQRLTDQETYPLVLGQLARGGTPTVVDRQLGLGYGAGAVRALSNNQSGVMVVFQPPDLKFVPMNEAINKIRTVPAESEFVQIARSLGISLGD